MKITPLQVREEEGEAMEDRLNGILKQNLFELDVDMEVYEKYRELPMWSKMFADFTSIRRLIFIRDGIYY